MLSERSNTFSQTLLPFSNTTGVVDTDDCAVELDTMLALVEKGCDELEASGMATNIRANMADSLVPICITGYFMDQSS